MPLTGEAKKIYQREYMRNYMRLKRGVKTPLRPIHNPVKTQEDVRPDKGKRLAKAKEALVNALKPETVTLQSIPSPVSEESNSNVLVYRRGGHYKIGQKLKDPITGVIFEMPELDEEGNPIW